MFVVTDAIVDIIFYFYHANLPFANDFLASLRLRGYVVKRGRGEV